MQKIINFLFILFPFILSGQEEKLEISGAIVISNSEATSPKEGTIRFNPDNNDFEGFDWEKWVSLTHSQNGETGFLFDIDKNLYKTVQIGTQKWMAENLKTTKFNDGTPIPNISDNNTWDGLTTPAYCWYDNDSISYSYDYGALYNFYTVDTTNQSNVCPVGWHVTTTIDWSILTNYLGGTSVAGGKLKEEGMEHWASPNHAATN